MKLSRISFLFLLLFLFVPSVNYAQSAASKSWNSFWTQFSAAVKNKDKVAVKRLMSSESDFLTHGGIGSRNDYLNLFKAKGYWQDVQKSAAKGTMSYDLERQRPARITKDKYLIFEYIGGKWRFVGVMGD